MLLVAKKGKEDEVLAVCKKWELDAAVIGSVTDSGRWIVKATPGYDPLDEKPITRASVVVCDLPTDALTDAAPVYDRPRAPFKSRATEPFTATIADAKKELLEMLARPNIGEKSPIFRQYDQIVRGGTLVRPGGDAAVVRVPCDTGKGATYKYLAFAVDCNGRYCELDPETGAKMAVAEVCRNLVVSGAEPLGITDCLNFASPEKPDVMESFARAVEGLAAGCNALGVPIVSGNVSLYNETSTAGGRVAILPTPSVAAVGQLADAADLVTPWWKRAGDAVLLLGRHDDGRGLGGSEIGCKLHGKLVAGAPSIDLDEEARLQKLVLSLARAHVLSSAHDVADGGLLVAIAECAGAGPAHEAAFGADITLSAKDANGNVVGLLFGEAPTRVIVSVSPANKARIEGAAKSANIACSFLGTTAPSTLAVTLDGKSFSVTADEIRSARSKALAFAL
jgi:phosphoribosylformylglycinamidine synthase